MSDEQHQDTGELRSQYQTYDRQKCFIAYSEQAYWSGDLLEAASEVLSEPEFNLEPDYARKHFESDIPLRQKAIELIANARYGIYDLSWWRLDDKSPWQMPRNVFIELGIAIALNRPTLLLRNKIENIKAAAVFVGSSGLRPWKELEIEALLHEFIKRQCPIIPVLLSTAPDKPNLPVFLSGNMWVDFRQKQPDPMTQLIWGITGKKP